MPKFLDAPQWYNEEGVATTGNLYVHHLSLTFNNAYTPRLWNLATSGITRELSVEGTLYCLFNLISHNSQAITSSQILSNLLSQSQTIMGEFNPTLSGLFSKGVVDLYYNGVNFQLSGFGFNFENSYVSLGEIDTVTWDISSSDNGTDGPLYNDSVQLLSGT